MKILFLMRILVMMLVVGLLPMTSFTESTSDDTKLDVKKKTKNKDAKRVKSAENKKKKSTTSTDVKADADSDHDKKPAVAPTYDRSRFMSVYRDGLKYRDQRRRARVQKRVAKVKKRIEKLKKKIEKATGQKKGILKGRLKENEWKLRRLLRGTTEAKGFQHRKIKTKRFAKYFKDQKGEKGNKNKKKKNKNKEGKNKKDKHKKDDEKSLDTKEDKKHLQKSSEKSEEKVKADDPATVENESKKPSVKAKATTLLKVANTFKLKKPESSSSSDSPAKPAPVKKAAPTVKKPSLFPIASNTKPVLSPVEGPADSVDAKADTPKADAPASDDAEKPAEEKAATADDPEKTDGEKQEPAPASAPKAPVAPTRSSIEKTTEKFVGTTKQEEREKVKAGTIRRRGTVASKAAPAA